MNALHMLNRIDEVIEWYGIDAIKARIGDSTDNNRTLSISQIKRFLATRRHTKAKELLRALNEFRISTSGVRSCLGTTGRTDALDYTEFKEFVTFLSSGRFVA